MAERLTYGQQLKTPDWQKRRLQRLDAAQWVCEKCQAQDAFLHVHHKQYFRGRMAWEYSDQELSVLCEQCHADAHKRLDLLSRLLTTIDAGYPSEAIALGLLAGYAYVGGDLSEDLAQEARAVAGPYFDDGMLAYAASLAPASKLAALVRETMKRYGFEMHELLEQQLRQWESVPLKGNL